MSEEKKQKAKQLINSLNELDKKSSDYVLAFAEGMATQAAMEKKQAEKEGDE